MIHLEFENSNKNVIVRNMTENDLDEVAELSIKVFGEDISLSYDQFESQVRKFPDGQICVEIDDKIVGNASSLIVNIDEYGLDHSYDDVCDAGYINNHDPKGTSLYGIEVGVDPEYRKNNIGRFLYIGRQEICKRLNLRNIYVGGRMPKYHKYSDELTPEQYVKKVIDGEIYDPIIAFQSRNGFEFQNVIAGYLPGDTESLEYGVLLKWANDEYSPK